MTRLRIQTPSRLHFGLFSWGPDAIRQFGGVGLMIDDPGLSITAEPAEDWAAEGPLADRALRVAREVARRLHDRNPRPLRFQIEHAPREHAGLGTGTQLSLGIARLVAEQVGWPEAPLNVLAEWTGRGRRSGVGLHGFALGGLIVDGGRRSEDGVPPLITRMEFPAAWKALVVIPPAETGLSGTREVEAFTRLPAVPDAVTDRLCRLVLLGMLPAIAEGDLVAFGAALTAIQLHVGRLFAPAQHGRIYASPDAEPIVAHLRSEGLAGVGQSSWGPTLYGFGDFDAERRAAILKRLQERFDLAREAAFWTQGSHSGARLERLG
jgi:beta-ribofuranosylaminobenzene 5'-phosphate synthase